MSGVDCRELPVVHGEAGLNVIESVFAFPCLSASLVGIISMPRQPRARGVLIIVGGPQYRVGSHRQFTLLARHMARAGVSVMRFDCRGMGDSEGDPTTFEGIDEDIRAAIDAFFTRVPQLKEVVLWGLCDAASAILFYAHRDARVSGITLVNPWIRTEQGLARAHLRHYYTSRLTDPALWRKIRAGEVNFGASLRGLWSALAKSIVGSEKQPTGGGSRQGKMATLPQRMLEGLEKYRGNVLLILSGNDITAREFEDAVHVSSDWRALLETRQVTRCELPGADHTFSRREWHNQVAVWTEEWLGSW